MKLCVVPQEMEQVGGSLRHEMVEETRNALFWAHREEDSGVELTISTLSFKIPRHRHTNNMLCDTCDKLLGSTLNGDFHDLFPHLLQKLPIRSQTHPTSKISFKF